MNSKSIEQYNIQLINNNSYTTNNLLKQFKLINLSAKQEALHSYRRTSAEIVSEAKNMLARGTTGNDKNENRIGSGGGVNGNVTTAVNGQQLQNNNMKSMGVQNVGTRLVSTRRPITPREPRRQLYDRVAPPGRPPSAFSLRYLQFESRALPSLGPIAARQVPVINPPELQPVQRAGSVGSLYDDNDGKENKNSTRPLQGKLPALLMPPKITASLDNLSEGMPPRKEFKALGKITNQKNDETNSKKNTTNNKHKSESRRHNTPQQQVKQNTSIVKDHPLKRRQTKSFDDKQNNFNNNNKDENDKIKNILVKQPLKKDNKNRLVRSNDLLGQSSTETLLDMLKAHSGIKECTEDTVTHINGILTELFTRVKGARGGWRGAVLGALYGLVECLSPKVLLSVARVVLALCVTGSNLTGACKLVFKVARNEINDNLFADSDVPELLIDGLGRASPIDEPEACIYGYGAVRFLANGYGSIDATTTLNNLNNNIINNKVKDEVNKNNLPKQKNLAYRLARHGAVQLMILHLQIINETGAQSKLSGQPLHALYQLSGALRAIAGVPAVTQSMNNKQQAVYTTIQTDNYPQICEIIETDDIQLELAGPHLVRAAEICIGEIEVQSNIVRTLSVLSEVEECCEVLSETVGRLGILLGPCYLNKNNNITDLPEKPLGFISRLGYILGNIMANWDSARIQFYNNDVAMEYLISTLEHYSNKKFIIYNQSGDTIIDVLIKLVRVIANMSVNSEVGFGLGTKPPLGAILLNLLLSLNNNDGTMTSELEELLLAILGALHNLSFYQDISDDINFNNNPGSMIERLSDIGSALCTTLSNGSVLARTEAARVLGNMTRSGIVRQSFCSAGGLKVLVKCLETDNIELIGTSCGVLVNLLGDWERRAPFRELRGPLLLRDVLQRSALNNDWLLAGIVCQGLWNFLIDAGNVVNALGDDEADYIAGDLVEYLDDEKLFNGKQPDLLWEQFAGVATDLLERIQDSISINNSPLLLSESEDDHDNGKSENTVKNRKNHVSIVNINNEWGDKFKKWLEE